LFINKEFLLSMLNIDFDSNYRLPHSINKASILLTKILLIFMFINHSLAEIKVLLIFAYLILSNLLKIGLSNSI